MPVAIEIGLILKNRYLAATFQNLPISLPYFRENWIESQKVDLPKYSEK